MDFSVLSDGFADGSDRGEAGSEGSGCDGIVSAGLGRSSLRANRSASASKSSAFSALSYRGNTEQPGR